VSPRSVRQRIDDILGAIDTIAEHRRRTKELGLQPGDPLLLDAVVRELALIGEAAAHLPSSLTDRHPDIPWKGVRGMRLLLDHEYHRVDAEVVWRTVDEDLLPLARALRTEGGAGLSE
jgi:uncharacterized protein with HEPN domain